MRWSCSKLFLLLRLSVFVIVSHGYTSQREVLTRENDAQENQSRKSMLRRKNASKETMQNDDSSFSSNSFHRKPERKMMEKNAKITGKTFWKQKKKHIGK